ncbi:unnamed protein product [Cochlearia groenlandica]
MLSITIPIRRILHTTHKPKPNSIISLFATVSSPPSNNLTNPNPPPPLDPLISDAVSILTHHRSKSRWSTLRSLNPSGFTPSQFSDITLLLRNNPRLSLRFFLFTRRHGLCTHDITSCSTLVHVLSRSRLKTQACEIIRLALRLSSAAAGEDTGDQRVYKLFNSLIKTYNRCGSAPFVFDLLIKSCLDSKLIDGAIMIARKLRSKGINLQISTCNALIYEVSRRKSGLIGYNLYIELFCYKEDETTKKNVAKIRPNANTFNSMLVSFCREGETDMVEKVWREMVELGCDPNGYSYSVLIETYCARGMMCEAEKTWEEMKFKGDVTVYNTMIGGYCDNLEVLKAKELFVEMGLKGIECTSLTYDHLINGYCKANDFDSGLVVYRETKRKGFEVKGLTIEALVERLCEDRNKGRDVVVEVADIVKDAVRESEFYPNRKCYELLIKRLCEEGMMERALNIQAEMVGRGFKPSQEIYKAFIEGYRRSGDEEKSALLALEMVESLKLRTQEEER